MKINDPHPPLSTPYDINNDFEKNKLPIKMFVEEVTKSPFCIGYQYLNQQECKYLFGADFFESDEHGLVMYFGKNPDEFRLYFIFQRTQLSLKFRALGDEGIVCLRYEENNHIGVFPSGKTVKIMDTFRVYDCKLPDRFWKKVEETPNMKLQKQFLKDLLQKQFWILQSGDTVFAITPYNIVSFQVGPQYTEYDRDFIPNQSESNGNWFGRFQNVDSQFFNFKTFRKQSK